MEKVTQPQPRVTSSDVLFCLTNSLNPKNIQFTIMYKEKHQTLTFEKLGLVHFHHFCLKKMTKTIIESRQLIINFLLID